MTWISVSQGVGVDPLLDQWWTSESCLNHFNSPFFARHFFKDFLFCVGWPCPDPSPNLAPASSFSSTKHIGGISSDYCLRRGGVDKEKEKNGCTQTKKVVEIPLITLAGDNLVNWGDFGGNETGQRWVLLDKTCSKSAEFNPLTFNNQQDHLNILSNAVEMLGVVLLHLPYKISGAPFGNFNGFLPCSSANFSRFQSLSVIFFHFQWFSITFSHRPPKRARKRVPCAKIVKKCRKDFWHFLTIFDVFCLRETGRKVSKYFWHFLTIFDVFGRGPFPLAPFAVRWFQSL